MSNFSQSVEFFAIQHGDRAKDRGRNRDRDKGWQHTPTPDKDVLLISQMRSYCHW